MIAEVATNSDPIDFKPSPNSDNQPPPRESFLDTEEENEIILAPKFQPITKFLISTIIFF